MKITGHAFYANQDDDGFTFIGMDVENYHESTPEGTLLKIIFMEKLGSKVELPFRGNVEVVDIIYFTGRP